MNDAEAYSEPWELENNIDEYVNEDNVAQGAGASPLRTTRKGSGRATVQTNRVMTYDIGVPFNGSLTGSIAVGSTLTGCNSNNNGIPDLLEKCIRNNRCRF